MAARKNRIRKWYILYHVLEEWSEDEGSCTSSVAMGIFPAKNESEAKQIAANYERKVGNSDKWYVLETKIIE